MRAPRVVAKGAHLLAQKIRDVGREHEVPVMEAPPLARALYHHAELGDEVPQPLYNAVAEVLAYVYQLRRYREGGGHAQDGAAFPTMPENLAVPAELDPEGSIADGHTRVLDS
jgi:flagellar biosynthesis protein FlhB